MQYLAINFVTRNNEILGDTLDVVTRNYTVEEIVNMISKRVKIKKKYVNTEILNQNSYEVISDKLNFLGLKFTNDIKKDIYETLKLLS